MESQSPPQSFLLLFDGPAHEQRICMVVPPEAVRWFVQGQEMGSDKTMDWWVMEKPPEDDSVLVTEYRIDPTVESTKDENGDTVLHYTCDDSKWLVPDGTPTDEAVEGLRQAGFDTEKLRETLMSDPELRDRISELAGKAGASYDDDPVVRAFFSPADIREILTTSGEWLHMPKGGKLVELTLEPDPTSAMKMGLGPMVLVEEDDDYMLVAPSAIAAMKMDESSIVKDDELQHDDAMKSLRISRERYDAQDAEAIEAIANAEVVTVVQPDGTLTEAKHRHPAQEESDGQG